MAAAEAPCKELDLLKRKYRSHMQAYKDAFLRLQELQGPDFKAAYQEAEQCRIAFEEARNQVRSHVLAHGCE
jgi:hypothetical protein